MDTELGEFPLRMRDWLKNVLVTLYERDEDNNLLNEKQKLRVSPERSWWNVAGTTHSSVLLYSRCITVKHVIFEQKDETQAEYTVKGNKGKILILQEK